MIKKRIQKHPAAKTKQQDAPAYTGKVLLSRKDIRREYGLSEKSVYRMERRNLLIPVRATSKVMYFRSDFEAVLRASMTPAHLLNQVQGEALANGGSEKEGAHV